MKKNIYDICYKYAIKAAKKNEVPIAAIIYNKKANKYFVSYNKTNKTKDPLMHAEIIVIKKMAKYLKDWRLNDCELFVTIEPCNMCKEIIKECRIKRIEYGYKSTYYQNNINIEEKNNKYIDLKQLKYSYLIKEFFNKKRKSSTWNVEKNGGKKSKIC